VAADAPPALVQAVFSAAGDSIALLMSHDTNRPGTTDCASLLTTAAGLGSGALCRWTSAREFTVFLGTAATVAPGDSIAVQGGLIVRAAPLSSPAAAQQSVAVQAPFPAVVPSVKLSVPGALGACDNLRLDISGSAGSGGRDWTQVSWSVSSRNPTAASSLSALNARLSGVTALTTTLPRGLLTDGVTYQFTASLSNYFGATGQASADVVTSGLNLPTLSVLGGSDRSVNRQSVTPISARASARGCDPRVAVPLTYSFAVQTGAITLARTDERSVSIAAGSMFPGVTYAVTVTVQVVGQPTLTTSTTVTLQVQSEPLSAVIAGGDRLVSPVSDLVLDASASIDPNNDALVTGGPSRAVAKSYAWTCAVASGSCASLATLLTGTNGTIPSAQLSAFAGQTLTFSVAFTAGSLTATTAVSIQVASVAVPSVGIAAPAAGRVVVLNGATVYKVNPSARVALTGSTDTPSGTARWALRQTDGSYSAAAAAALFSTPATQTSVVVRAGALTAGLSYQLRLTVQGTLPTALGAATVTLLANTPPRLGSVQTSAANGTELNSTITVSAQRWIDDAADLPLTYQFFVSSAGATPTTQQLAQRSFGSPLGSASLSSSANVLVPSSSHPNGRVTIVVYISDSAGATSSAVTSIVSLSALAADASAADVQNFVDNSASLVAASLGDGDTEGALSVVSSLGSVMNSASGSGAVDAAVQQRRIALRTQLTNSVSAALTAGNGTASQASQQAALGAVGSLTSAPTEVSDAMRTAVLNILDAVLGTFGNSRRLATGSVEPLSIATAEQSVDVLRNLLDSDAAGSTGARALQARSSTSDDVLSKLLIIHARVVADAQPNEAAVALTSGLDELVGTAACVPTATSTVAMQSQVLQCSTGITQQGTDEIGTAVSTVETCNSGDAAFFGAGGAASTPATVRSPSVAITADASAAVCGSPVSVQLLALTRPLAAAASAQGAISASTLGLSADSGVTVSSVGSGFNGPTVHVAATSGNARVSLAAATVTVTLPLTVKPAVPASAVLVLRAENATTASRRVAVAAQDAGAAAGNYSVTCPTDTAAYTSGAAVVTVTCPAGDHSVSCAAAEAGGTKFGACPVDAFTAACLSYDTAASSWSDALCTVTEVSNDYVTCECSDTGAFSPAFATVTRGATTNFEAAADGGGGAADDDDDDSFGAGPIVAVTLLFLAVVLVGGVWLSRRSKAQAARRERANRQRVLVTGAGAQRVDADDAAATAAAQQSVASYRA